MYLYLFLKREKVSHMSLRLVLQSVLSLSNSNWVFMQLTKAPEDTPVILSGFRFRPRHRKTALHCY